MSGFYVTGCFNGNPVGKVKHSEDQITLKLSYNAGDICANLLALYSYEARLTQVPPGSYQLRVEHAEGGLYGPSVTMEQQIDVP